MVPFFFFLLNFLYLISSFPHLAFSLGILKYKSINQLSVQQQCLLFKCAAQITHIDPESFSLATRAHSRPQTTQQNFARKFLFCSRVSRRLFHIRK